MAEQSQQNVSEPIFNERAALQVLSTLVSRASLASGLGLQYNGYRDTYTALGYPLNPQYQDYLNEYSRGDIAKTLIEKPVKEIWGKPPEIWEVEDDETPFEAAWQDLEKSLHVFSIMQRLDTILGLGRYAVLFLGFSDGKRADEPVEPKSNLQLLYVKPYSEQNANIIEWEADTTNPRYSKPKYYTLKSGDENRAGMNEFRVHHSRILHIVEDPLEDDVYGTPRLKAIFNRLFDKEKLAGGSAEMFWRGARPGYAAIARDGFQMDSTSKDAMQTELDEFEHNLRRWLRLQGVDIEPLAPQVVSPKDHLDVILTLIAATANIPKRILLGSERGELASSQDERAWAETKDARRKNFCEPVMVRPFIDRLLELGVLPPLQDPKAGYVVDWPEILIPSEKEKAEVGKIKSETLANYARTPGADMIVSPQTFLEECLNFDQDQIEQNDEYLGKMAKEEPEEEEEEELEEEVIE